MSREFLEEFIKIYESEPCLWQIKSKDYYDRAKKEVAYARLIEKMKTMYPAHATRVGIVKKINNIRCAYRKEIKKIRASLKSGTGEVYEPKLWYFKLLRFLDGVEIPRNSYKISGSNEDDAICNIEEYGEEDLLQDNRANIEAETVISEDATWVENVQEVPAAQSVPSTVTPQKRPLKKIRLQEIHKPTLTNGVLFTVKEPFKKTREEEDRFHVFGKTVAMKLRTLPKEQMLIAEKLINDTLFQAEMGNLTLSYRLVSEECPSINQQI